jgi:hypothetical protein
MELQPRNNPLNEDAALLKRYAVGGGPDGPKLRIGEGDHVTMVLSARWMSTAPSRPKERVAPMAKNMKKDHSISSSARESSVGGTVMPSASAVFILMASSKRVGCSTGKSAG